MNVEIALQQAARLLLSDSPRLDIELLLAKSLGKPRSYLRTWPHAELDDIQTAEFLSRVSRRAAGEPIAYILGEQEFWSLVFKVNSSTLIPRSDTELLVQVALNLLPRGAKVLDLGTGTGCIALALAHQRADLKVTAIDAAPGACELARSNAESLGLTHVTIYQSFWFDQVAGCFDVITSNPPYIDAADSHLTQLVFEPQSALVAGEDGLADLRHIIVHAPSHLAPGGWLIVEHGWRQGSAVRALMSEQGYQGVETHQDLGGNDRVTAGQKF